MKIHEAQNECCGGGTCESIREMDQPMIQLASELQAFAPFRNGQLQRLTAADTPPGVHRGGMR
jgi:hypothetical protein